MPAPNLIEPQWAATRVRACSSTRVNPITATQDFNLKPEQDCQSAHANRAQLQQHLQLQQAPIWLQQVHGVHVVRAEHCDAHTVADACWTTQKNLACAVLTADCMPVVLAHRHGDCVGVAHAGWRGLSAGILEATIAAMPAPASELIAWLGPTISAQHFEVGADVHAAFCTQHPEDAPHFMPVVGCADKWRADLYGLGKRRLQALQVGRVYGGEYCTYGQPDRFFSYRRDGPQCGRMATLVWIH